MNDKILFNKILKGLTDICDRQKIGRIDKFHLILNDDYEISSEGLHEHLKEDLPNNVFPSTTIVIERRNIAILSALIYKVEGERIEAI